MALDEGQNLGTYKPSGAAWWAPAASLKHFPFTPPLTFSVHNFFPLAAPPVDRRALLRVVGCGPFGRHKDDFQCVSKVELHGGALLGVAHHMQYSALASVITTNHEMAMALQALQTLRPAPHQAKAERPFAPPSMRHGSHIRDIAGYMC